MNNIWKYYKNINNRCRLVGLISGVCLTDFGNNITCIDNDKGKINILNKGRLPIYKPGLKEIIERNGYYERIEFITDIKNIPFFTVK